MAPVWHKKKKALGLPLFKFEICARLFLDFPVEGPALEGRIVLHLFNLLGLLARIACCHVTRRRLALFASFCAFDDYYFSGHFFSFLKIDKGHILFQNPAISTLFLTFLPKAVFYQKGAQANAKKKGASGGSA